MKKLLGILLVLGTAATGWSQQDPMYSQYLHNELAINPAYAGARDAVSGMILYRHQWVGIEGAPRTLSATVHAPVGKQVGLGLNLTRDEVGPILYNGAFGSYSYTLNLNETLNLALGATAGIRHYTIDFQSLRDNGPNQHLIPTKNETRLVPNVGMGVYLYSNRFAVGIGAPQLMTNRYAKVEQVNLNTYQHNHYFLTAAYLIDLTDWVKLKPGAAMRFVNGGPVNIDVTGNVILHDRFWLGATLRTDRSVAFLGQAIMPKRWTKGVSMLRLGYAMDMHSSSISRYTKLSHEIFVGIDLAKNSTSVVSPRYF